MKRAFLSKGNMLRGPVLLASMYGGAAVMNKEEGANDKRHTLARGAADCSSTAVVLGRFRKAMHWALIN
eukprot:919412-Pelagomonas_calceolata.AAC.6